MTYEPMETKIPKGSIVTFDSGEYSETMVTPPLKAKTDVDLKHLYIIYLNTISDYILECGMENDARDFQQWLEASAYFEPIPCDRIVLGGYRLNPDISAGNEDHIETLRHAATDREEARLEESRQRQRNAEIERFQKIADEATKP